MHEVSARVNGGLVALVGKDNNFHEQLHKLRIKGIYVALKNSPDQSVVGGKLSDLENVINGLPRGIEPHILEVEGPFHTEYMKDAADLLKPEIDGTQFRVASTPIVANASALFIVDPNHIKDELYYQTFSSGEWMASISRMIQEGINFFIISGMNKRGFLGKTVTKLDKTADVFAVYDIKTLAYMKILDLV